MKTKSGKENCNIKTVIVSILAILMLLSVNGIADEVSVSSAGAEAVASGNEIASVSTQATVSGSMASSSATAFAVASNGETATATATTWASISNTAYAFAQAVATAVSNIGETVWAGAHVDVSVSIDGTSSASAESAVGIGRGEEWNHGNGGDDGSDNNGNVDNTDPIVVAPSPIVATPPPKDRAFFGFVFGKSDVERYYYFKNKAENSGGLTFEDNNVNQTLRARYYMNIIARDNGLNESEFEDKYKIDNITIEEINKMKDIYTIK